MEDSSTRDQSSVPGKSASKLLRYPLRSASRSKEEKPPLADSMNTQSATKRGRLASSMAKSVGVLDLSGKEKPAKPPRRLSVPSNSNASPAPKSFGNRTPISEARSKRSASQGKSDTPVSTLSKSSSIRKKFCTISSASYWLSQIKLSESAAKHSISLGFFKLALEAGCEPMQKMREELKSYVRRHNPSELEETIKELFESYKISENYEPSEISRACSEATPEPNQASDDDVGSSSSSITDVGKLKPKALDVNSDEINQVEKSNNEITQKDDSVQKKTIRSVPKNVASSKPTSEVRGRSTQRKPRKQLKQDSVQDNNDKVKKLGKKSAQVGEVAGPLNSPPKEDAEENKENIVEEIAAEV
ncbi:hypothetical protein ACS0TY_034478 [Phlomoides rotata]